MVRLSTAIALLFILSTPFIAKASHGGITRDLIINKNEQMQILLNKRDPHKTIDFLHSHVSESAIFQISFQNTSMPPNTQKQHMEMDKTDYINSFIQGLNYVDHYGIKIETKNIQIAANGKTAIAEETIIEEGIMLDPNNLLDSGIPFLSKTTCKVLYGLDSGIVQSNKARCHTQTGEINTI